MVTITQEQALRRWDTLPESLKEALSSENSSITLWRVCEAEHIPEGKIYTIAKIAGWVLLGFLHPEEVTRETRDRLGINPEVAANISKALDSRIFSRIRDDLNKIYAPAGEEPSYTPPKTLEEIRRPTGAPEQALVSEGKAIPSPTSPIQEPETSFEEKPIILHEETEFEPGKTASGFKLETPPPKFDESGEKFAPPMRPARLEIGIEIKPPTEEPKVINYTQAPATKPLMSPEQELPAPPKPIPPVSQVYPTSPFEPAPRKPAPIPQPPPFKSMPAPLPPLASLASGGELQPASPSASLGGRGEPIQKKRRGFWGWLKSLFSPRPKKEIIFAPKIISEEELKRETLTIKASMPASLRGEPKPPPPPPRPTPTPQPTYAPRPSEPFRTPATPQPSEPSQPTQRPARGPSVFEEVVDLSTLTKAKKLFPPPDSSSPESGNTVDLTPKT